MCRFTIATLSLLLGLCAATVFGGIWAYGALGYITVFTYFMDKISALQAPDDPGQEFPAGNGLLVVIGALQMWILFAGGAQIARGAFGTGESIALFLAIALFLGQVVNPAAHELIHRSPRALRHLGVVMYCAILFGQHASAHLRLHHIYAASDKDPNSAPKGMGFYRFFLRAWGRSLIDGYREETRLRGLSRNPYRIYAAYALLSLGLAYALAGWAGVLVHLGLATYAQIQLLLSDYVQHYGLRRQVLPNGKLEPVGPQHSWNAPNGFSSALMLNAPRHSDHHSHPDRAYPGLRLDQSAMPILPHSLPVMALIALVPPLWKRIMDPRVGKWLPSPATPPQ